MTEGVSGGVVNTIGGDDNQPQELNVTQDNHQRTFLVKNPDGSLEIMNVVKRTTADLVLPDNRMASVMFVDYHRSFDTIPLDTFGLRVIIGRDLSLKDSIVNTMNTIHSVEKGRKYQYIVFNERYEPITDNKEIEIPEYATLDPMNPGGYLLTLVKREEPDITDIKEGYITIIRPDIITPTWFESAVMNGISIVKEDEVPITNVIEKES